MLNIRKLYVSERLENGMSKVTDYIKANLGLMLDGKAEQAEMFRSYAKDRKEKMERYMLEKESGIFYDYNFEKDCFSSVASCASLYPFAVGLSDDKEAAKKVLEKLELPYGLAACEYRGEETDYLQWDYPSMWPSNVYFAYVGVYRFLKEQT